MPPLLFIFAKEARITMGFVCLVIGRSISHSQSPVRFQRISCSEEPGGGGAEGRNKSRSLEVLLGSQAKQPTHSRSPEWWKSLEFG